MDFKKKLKTRLYLGIVYILLGIAIIAITFIKITDNSFLSSFGFCMVVIGLVRVRNYALITKNEETIRKQEIIENDERTISIIHKARSTTFIVYIITACISVIVLAFLGFFQISKWISCAVALFVLIYWICYLIYNKIT
jgi:uncharacterized membrane protein